MRIYLIQFQNEKRENVGTPYLTASVAAAEAALIACKKNNCKAYIHQYDVKTQGKNINDFAKAQYYDETEGPF